MKGYSAIQCGVLGNATVLNLDALGEQRYIYANNPIKLQSVTLTMLSGIAAAETVSLALSRSTTQPPGLIASMILDDTCKQYDSIVLDVSDYGNSSGDAGDSYIVKVMSPTTTAANCLVTFNYILIESGEPVWNVGQTVDPAGNLVTGIKQKRNRVGTDTSVIRDATPFYTRQA